MLNCKVVVETMDNTVTHMIVLTEDDLKTKRTLKYFQAVASGVTVVSHLWVLACMEDMRNLDRADKWEVKDEGGTNGPMLARKTKEEGREPLLSGFEVGIKGEIDGLENSCIDDLLSRAGARAVLNKTPFSMGVTKLVLVDNLQKVDEQEVAKFLKKYKLAIVTIHWLLDTLDSHTVRPILRYTLNTVQREDLIQAGYSGSLVD